MKKSVFDKIFFEKEFSEAKGKEEMIKFFKTIPNQIIRLKQLGLIIQDEEKAQEILSDIGIYRLGF